MDAGRAAIHVHLSDEQQARIVECSLAGVQCYESILLSLLRKNGTECLIVSYHSKIIRFEMADLCRRMGLRIFYEREHSFEIGNGSELEFVQPTGLAVRGWQGDLIWLVDCDIATPNRWDGLQVVKGIIR